MLVSTSKGGIKSAFEYIVKLPFAKNFLHKLSELARGKCIVFFSLHRVLDAKESFVNHPHYASKTALTTLQAHKLLSLINHRLPFISLRDSLNYLKGKEKLEQSCSVLLIDVPYLETLHLLCPYLQEQKIPASIVLNTESIHDGKMPWMDEISYLLGKTEKREFSANFIDRSFALNSIADRVNAARHFTDHLSQLNAPIFLSRLEKLRDSLAELSLFPIKERIATIPKLKEIASNPLFSFACGGSHRAPLFDMTPEDAYQELAVAKQELFAIFNEAFVPVFIYPRGSDRLVPDGIADMLMDYGYEAAITRQFGVCRPGDNMFALKHLPLAQSVNSFEQYELQGLSAAIDELLLVTFAQEQEL